MKERKMQPAGLKMQDQMSGVENVKSENAGPENYHRHRHHHHHHQFIGSKTRN